MRCTTAGCGLLAEQRNGASAMDSDKCCDYCPTSHTWACLSRHTADERADALRHQAAHDTTGDVQSSSSAPAEPPHEPSAWETVTNVYDFESAVPRARSASPGDDISPISGAKTTSTSTNAGSSTARIDAVTKTVLQAASGARREAARNVADDTAMDARWMASESRLLSEADKAAAAHDQAFATNGIKRAADGEVRLSTAAPAQSTMPVITSWVTQQQGKVTPEQVKRMIVEMTSVNRQKWSHEAIRAAVGGPRGSVHHVMASLASGPLSASESYAFCEIDFENDPLRPDWQNLEKEGILPTLREAKSRIYAEGSQGKIRTALNRWMHFTATKARVSFIRPRVGDDPEAFMTESLLRQAFVADCVSDGCNLETAEQYASLFNCWHIDTMGYGLVSSRSFEDEQFRRTNQGLRRMFPSKRIDRAAHPVEINESVLRSSLSEVLAIYDEPSTTMIDKRRRIELAFSRGAGGGFDRGLVEDLVFSTLTELMTDGLLRPGEGVPKKGFISQSDISFKRGACGKLESATVMITPIKRRGKHVGDKSKKPVVVAAHRGGALRTAELLDILNMVAPCAPGAEATTPAIRFPVSRIEGLNHREAKALTNLTMAKVMKWYHRKCAASGRVPNHDQVKPHSFRIAGATLLFTAGVTADEIKTMGRWASDVYRIYCRLSKERLLDLSKRMSNASSTQFLNGADGFMELPEVEAVESEEHPGGPDDDQRLYATEEVEAEIGDETDEREAEPADDDSDTDSEVGDGDEASDSDAEAAVLCEGGPMLTDSQIRVGAPVAVPFTLDGSQVHFEGRISSMTSSSKVYVAFPGERSWLAARERLFEIVALPARGKRSGHDATIAARVSTLVGVDGDDTER